MFGFVCCSFFFLSVLLHINASQLEDWKNTHILFFSHKIKCWWFQRLAKYSRLHRVLTCLKFNWSNKEKDKNCQTRSANLPKCLWLQKRVWAALISVAITKLQMCELRERGRNDRWSFLYDLKTEGLCHLLWSITWLQRAKTRSS